MNAHNKQPAAAQEAVAEVCEDSTGCRYIHWSVEWFEGHRELLPTGTKLYAAPVTAAPAGVTRDDAEQVIDRIMGEYGFSMPSRAYAELVDEFMCAPAAPGIDWPHIANEYADATCNGIQWLRNIRDGISTVDDALADMGANYARIQNLQIDASPKGDHPAGTPTMPDGQFYDGCWERLPRDMQQHGRMLTQSGRTADSTELKRALEAGVLALMDSPKGGSDAAKLLSAAKDFYNGTVADPAVRISCSTKKRRDRVNALGERLRDELKAAQAGDAEVQP